MDEFDLKGLREAADLSQADLGARLGWSQSQVSRAEANPDEVSLKDLRRWRAACTPSTGLGAEAPTKIGNLVFHAQEVVLRYVDRWTTPTSLAQAPGLPDRASAKRILRASIQKPIVSVAGYTDSGKTRTINEILGSAVLPVRLGALTRALCMLVHIKDRPSWAREECYVLGREFDPLYWFSQPDVERNLLASGPVSSIADFVAYRSGEHSAAESLLSNVRPNEGKRKSWGAKLSRAITGRDKEFEVARGKAFERPDIHYALCFVGAPILESCILIDPPGFSGAAADIELASNALRISDAVLLHMPIVSSGESGKVSGDAMLLNNVLSLLRESTGLDGPELVQRIVPITTHFPDDAAADAPDHSREYMLKLIHTLKSMRAVSGLTRYSIEDEDIERELAGNVVANVAKDGAGRSRIFAAIRTLLRYRLEPGWAAEVQAAIHSMGQHLALPFKSEADIVARHIGRITTAEKELHDYRAKLNDHNFKKSRERQEIHAQSHVYEAEVEQILAARLNLASDWQHIKEFLSRHFGANDKDKAKEQAYALFLSDIQREFDLAVTVRTASLDERARAFMRQWELKLHNVHVEGASETLALQTTASRTVAQLGAALGLGGATSMIAAVLTSTVMPPLIVVLPFIGLLALLGDWKDKLAKNMVKALEKNSVKAAHIDANAKLWREWRDRFDEACAHAEQAELRYVQTLEEITLANGADKQAHLERKLTDLRLGATFFSELPAREATMPG